MTASSSRESDRPRFEWVRACGLGRAYGDHYAVAALNATFPAGEVTAVLGPNGAGKSTVLRMLSTLLAPTEGRVRYGSVDRPSGSPDVRSVIGYVGHELMIYPSLTARENLRFFGRLYGVTDPADTIDALLDEVGLPLDKDRPVDGFSRGMGQRLALARAVLHQPSLLLLDEPFTGLDDRGVQIALELFARLREEGAIVVLASHDLTITGTLATRMLVLKRGRALYEGAIDGDLAPAYRRVLDQGSRRAGRTRPRSEAS